MDPFVRFLYAEMSPVEVTLPNGDPACAAQLTKLGTAFRRMAEENNVKDELQFTFQAPGPEDWRQCDFPDIPGMAAQTIVARRDTADAWDVTSNLLVIRMPNSPLRIQAFRDVARFVIFADGKTVVHSLSRSAVVSSTCCDTVKPPFEEEQLYTPRTVLYAVTRGLDRARNSIKINTCRFKCL